MPMDSFVLAAKTFFLESGTASDCGTLRIIDRRCKFKTVQPHRKRFARHKQKRFSCETATAKFLAKPIAYGRRAIFPLHPAKHDAARDF